MLVVFFSCQQDEIDANPLPHDLSVLVLGNSIVKYNADQSIGWYYNCGMAATPNNDFVSIVKTALLTTHHVSNYDVTRIVAWERTFSFEGIAPSSKAYNVIIVKLGENVIDIPKFIAALPKLVGLYASVSTRIVLISSIWHRPEMDAAIQAICYHHGYRYADVSMLQTSGAYYATGEYANREVAAHPNNVGHWVIARSVLKQLR